MVQAPNKPDFTNQKIYVGIDVAKKSWKVCIYLGAYYHCRFVQPPDPETLVRYLRTNFPNGNYNCVYEAGCFGFWIHNALTQSGVHCVVVNPADVPTAHWERSRKTDRVDAHKLARSLAANELRSLYVPDRKAMEDRTMVRLRGNIVREQTRYKNRIKAMLLYYGINTPEGLLDRHWSRKYLDWLEQIRLEHASGDYAFRLLLDQLISIRKTIADLTKRIRLLSQEDAYRNNVQLLCTIPGVSPLAAMAFMTEIISVRRFKDLDHIASYTGLVPGEHSSGEVVIDTGLTHRRNPMLRLMLVECAWTAAKRDPALLACFSRYATKMPKNKAIVKIARKLLSRICFVLKNQVPYELSIAGTSE
jgi:transposase